jgi:peroxiredoxin
MIKQPAQTAQTRSHVPLIMAMVGLIVVAVVMLWDHPSPPLDPADTTHVSRPSATPSTELAALFAAMGIRRPAEPADAPDFTLMSLESQVVQLRALRGRLVLLNFWATWCAPCVHEMPSMERLYQTFKQTDFVLLAVSMDRQGEKVAKPFVEQLKVTFPILLDRTSEVGHQYGVRGLPTTYLIDPDGRLIGAAIGAREWYRTEAKALIAGLLRHNTPTAAPPAQAQPSSLLSTSVPRPSHLN